MQGTCRKRWGIGGRILSHYRKRKWVEKLPYPLGDGTKNDVDFEY
jgi:hypothetical protein